MDVPNYYAIIPANVRYDKTLTPNAKLLYAEITALCNLNGYCHAKNIYFAELYDVSITSVSKWISSLVDNGYISTQLIYKEGTKEILNRYIRILQYPIEEKLKTPIEEKLKDNNTSINITSINNSIVGSEEISSPTHTEEKKITPELFPEETRVNTSYDFGENPKKVAQKKVDDTDKAKKTLFRNSDLYKIVKFDEDNNGDFSEFEKLFKGPNFDSIDLAYYFHVVCDWSDQKDMKRSRQGWIATVRQFIRGDSEKNKLKLKVEFRQNHQKADDEEMLQFLNNNF